jgi:HK97 family phage prohead protease
MTDDLLCRDMPYELRANEGGEGDGLTLEGYAAVFNSPTRIDSWEGTFDEEIAPGAFARSLRERTPVLQFDHGKHPFVGSIPIGAFESIEEDERGLPVRARLHDNALVQPVRDAIRSKAIPGMSFRFSVDQDEWRDAAGTLLTGRDITRALERADRNNPDSIPKRTLREVKLFELGPVVFPAYADTLVGVRDQSSQTEPSDAKGASGEGRDAVTDEPQESAPSTSIPSPAARDRALRLERE